MTWLEDNFTLDMSVADASSACHGAMAELGWKVKETDANRIVAKAGVGLGRFMRTGNPSTITILLTGAGDAQTRANVKASNFGLGPLQRRQLQRDIDKLRDKLVLQPHGGHSGGKTTLAGERLPGMRFRTGDIVTAPTGVADQSLVGPPAMIVPPGMRGRVVGAYRIGALRASVST
jgi:hypothetical protein